MVSGVEVSDDCISAWETMKLRKNATYMFFKIEDYKKIVLDKSGTGDYQAFLSDLPEKDCRYCCVDFPYEGKTGPTTKLIFILWAPEASPVKDRMVYASSKDGLTKRLEGIARILHASDMGEVARETVTQQIA